MLFRSQGAGRSFQQHLNCAGQSSTPVQTLQHHQPQHHRYAIDTAFMSQAGLLFQILQHACTYGLLIQIQKARPWGGEVMIKP